MMNTTRVIGRAWKWCCGCTATSDRLVPIRVTPLQAGVTLYLHWHLDVKLKEVAAALGVQPPTINTTISQLPALRFNPPPPRMGLPARPLCPSRFGPTAASPCNAPSPTTLVRSKAKVPYGTSPRTGWRACLARWPHYRFLRFRY